jgi:outer membrane protein OmpA-like peptidoglycan-associated protein
MTSRTWNVFTLIVAIILSAAALPAQQADAKDCKDSPLFTRIPGHWIYNCKQSPFDRYEFLTAPGKKTAVEGQLWKITYYPNRDLVAKQSELQVIRNHENAITRIGGSVVFEDRARCTLKLLKDGKETWIEVWAEFTGKYGLVIVQKEDMVQDVVADAAALKNDINASGHAAVYGIYFDTGKATIKPESAAAIAEIAKLLKGDPALKLFVVGHTDNEGTIDGNIALSQARGEAVLKALVGEHGIAAARLRSFGCGQFAPVASNAGPEGRARNRRVELVKQ